MKKVIVLLALFSTAVFAQEKGSFTDPRDKKTYKTVKIGNLTWMAENLNYAAEGSVCYDNNPANCAKYGRLYNWATAMKACPKGWHLPSNAEWAALAATIQSEQSCSNCDAKYLKATSGWNEDGNGLDSYGFAALPGGLGNSDGDFGSAGINGYWWSSSESDAGYAYYRDVLYYNEDACWNDISKAGLISVRCVQNICSNKAYDSETHFCHIDKIYKKCSDQIYIPEMQTCRGNKIYYKCGNEFYNPEMQFCHSYYKDNKIYYKVYAKCGDQPYNPEMQTCRDNKVHFKCGNQIYNNETQFCHTDNKIYSKCGGKNYNAETQACCDKQIYNSETQACCDKQIYNSETQFCHTDNKIYTKCGGKNYNAQTQACCDKQIYNSETQYCKDLTTHTKPKCGDKLYDPKIQSCCGDQIYIPIFNQVCHTDNKIYSKCDDELYDPKTHYCRTTDGTIHTYSKCGNKPYIPEKQSCCGDSIYIPQTHLCNNGLVKKCNRQTYSECIKDYKKCQEDYAAGLAEVQQTYSECIKNTSDYKKCQEDYAAQLKEPCTE